VEVGRWYWIPQTALVAVRCTEKVDGKCILAGPSDLHGTGSAGLVATENPEALIAFSEGDGSIQPFRDGGIPVDVFSVSWGETAPAPFPKAAGCPADPTNVFRLADESAPIYVTAGGNSANVVPLDCVKGNPAVIVVGGGGTAPPADNALAAHMADVESYFCPPTANASSTTAMEVAGSWCGTSFAAPMVAAGLSKAVLAVRRSSGYDGGMAESMIDPLAGITASQLRDSLNRTASYTPPPRFPLDPNVDFYARLLEDTMVPLNPAAPWLQWGWGFYDGNIANDTIADLLGTHKAPEKPQAARDYMETLYASRQQLYG
jgi:hypothetical protein